MVVFTVDQNTGLLEPAGQVLDIEAPVCILFVPGDRSLMKFFPTKLSRRALVQNAGTWPAPDCLAWEPARCRGSAARGKPRALALIGDRYHNPDYIRVSLDKVFQDLGIPVDYTIQYDQISAALLKNYQLLLILRDGMIWPRATSARMPMRLMRKISKPLKLSLIQRRKTGSPRSRDPRSRNLLRPAMAFMLCITAATSRSAPRTIVRLWAEPTLVIRHCALLR